MKKWKIMKYFHKLSWCKKFKVKTSPNTEFRYSAFSRAVSALLPFEVREGMEFEHTLETDLTRCYQDLEEGDRFESSDLRLERCFLALLRVDTQLILSFVLRNEIAFFRICLPWGEGKLFQANCLTTSFSVSWAGGRAGQLKMRWDKAVHETEQVSLKEFPRRVDVGESRGGRPF